MKKSIKIVLVLLILSILFIIVANSISSKDDYYRHVSDTVIGFYRSANYDKDTIKDKDKEALDNYLKTLTHIDEEICVSDYVIKKDEYKTYDKNSKNIYLKDGKCYIKYSSLNIARSNKSNFEEMESYDSLVCNGYVVVLYKSMFNDNYKDTIHNPKYDYVFDSFIKTDNTYIYKYKSSYDGTKAEVILTLEGTQIIKVEVKGD